MGLCCLLMVFYFSFFVVFWFFVNWSFSGVCFAFGGLVELGLGWFGFSLINSVRSRG